MERYQVTFLPTGRTLLVEAGTTLLQAEIRAGLTPYAPCGGRGTCGKCKVTTQAGVSIPACQTIVDRDMTVTVPVREPARILTDGLKTDVTPDGIDEYVLAVDIGTTTVVAYLLSGITGEELAKSSCLNPQGKYGADVISRIQFALEGGGEELAGCIRQTLKELTDAVCGEAGIAVDRIGRCAIVGNTAMHHLLLGIDPKPLVTPPYMPREREARVIGNTRILPNIAGFVGGDTVGCLTAARFDRIREPTLLIDIGTNGEMVLTDGRRYAACSTAAGPAFEGAKISCGMRGENGAVDHVTLKNGAISYHVLGEGSPRGLCGSGLLDLVAVLLEKGIIDEMGALEGGSFRLCDNVVLTQKDVREVQLAKAAIRAGITLMAEYLAVPVEEIRQVLLAGAFGNYLDPASACRIGMIPPVLLPRVCPIGNAAGAGAKLCALSQKEFDYACRLAEKAEFLELAGYPGFQDHYVDCLTFEEDEK